VEPLTARAREWIEDNVSKEGYQPYWPSLIVEPRFLDAILEGMTEDGLVEAPATTG